MKSGVLITIAAAFALLALAAAANATHVQCGDTLTETTVLDSDLVCANAGEDFVGLTIAADGVILWMNGHTLRSETGYGTGVMVPDGPGLEYDNIEVRRGNFQGWTKAIDMSTSDSAVLKVSISEPGYPVDLSGTQIKVVGDRNYLARNYVDGSLYRQLPDDDVGVRGMSIQGDDAYTWGNTFLNSDGINSHGDRPRHVLNTVQCGLFPFDGIAVEGYVNGAVINRNVVSQCSAGIWALGEGDAGGALIRLNEAYGNSEGITVQDGAAIIGRNMASDNLDWGIWSLSAGTTIQNNTANDNGYIGIDAAPGIIDGGGNTATGNGTAQCVNVQCGTP